MLWKSWIEELCPEQDRHDCVSDISQVSVVELNTCHIFKEVVPSFTFSPISTRDESKFGLF
jgi:hypothetical protein